MLTDGEIAALNGFSQHQRETQEAFARKDNVIQRLTKRVKELDAALRVKMMHSAGTAAQVDALYDALKAVDPNNALFKQTGKRLPDGRLETVLTTKYYKGFDAKGKELQVENPERLRESGE